MCTLPKCRQGEMPGNGSGSLVLPVNKGWPTGLEPAPSGATIRRHRLPGVALSCRIGSSKPVFLLAIAPGICVLHAEWCQQWCQHCHHVPPRRGHRAAERLLTQDPQEGESWLGGCCACHWGA